MHKVMIYLCLSNLVMGCSLPWRAITPFVETTLVWGGKKKNEIAVTSRQKLLLNLGI